MTTPPLDAVRFFALTAALSAAVACSGRAGAGPAVAAPTEPVAVNVPPPEPEAAETQHPVATVPVDDPGSEGGHRDESEAVEYWSSASAEGGLGALYGASGEGAVSVLSGSGAGLGGLGGLGAASHGPRVTAGSATAAGSLDRDVIHRVVRSNLSRVKQCYQLELAGAPTLRAKATVQFVIGTSGHVSSASVVRPSGVTSLDQCLVDVAKRMRFPAPKGGVVKVSYPFVFQPG